MGYKNNGASGANVAQRGRVRSVNGGDIMHHARYAVFAIAATLLLAGCGTLVTTQTPTANPAATPATHSATPTPKATIDDNHLSRATLVYFAASMPKLAKITRDWQTGKFSAAIKMWKALPPIPETTTADQVAGKDYLTYANDVRYYIVGDGSVNLKQLEDARATAEATIESLL